MSQRNTFPISPFLRCILESVFSHLFQMPRPHEWLLWHRSTLTSHWSQLLSVVQRLEKNKSKQNLVFQGAIYVGQDLASTTSPSASRTESYLIDLCKEKSCTWVAAWLLSCLGGSHGKCGVSSHRRITQWPGSKTERQRKQERLRLRWVLLSLLLETPLWWNVWFRGMDTWVLLPGSPAQFSSLDTSHLEDSVTSSVQWPLVL